MAKIAKLVVTKGAGKGLTYTMKEGEEVSIGRNVVCSIPVPDIKLSRIHCIIRHQNNGFELLDNNSTNGTFVNSDQASPTKVLSSEDVIEIGDSEIQFLIEEE